MSGDRNIFQIIRDLLRALERAIAEREILRAAHRQIAADPETDMQNYEAETLRAIARDALKKADEVRRS